MTITVTIPAVPQVQSIKLSELRHKARGTIARGLSGSNQKYRFVKGSGTEVTGFVDDQFFDTCGKSWEEADVVILPDASLTINFSE
jgi:hypothetical protein